MCVCVWGGGRGILLSVNSTHNIHNPFNYPFMPLYLHACSPHCSLYISYVTHQHTSSVVIISLILVT